MGDGSWGRMSLILPLFYTSSQVLCSLSTSNPPKIFSWIPTIGTLCYSAHGIPCFNPQSRLLSKQSRLYRSHSSNPQLLALLFCNHHSFENVLKKSMQNLQLEMTKVMHLQWKMIAPFGVGWLLIGWTVFFFVGAERWKRKIFRVFPMKGEVEYSYRTSWHFIH